MTTLRQPTPDLAPAEGIQPSALQSDTFVQPAQLPVDQDLERLTGALGHFNSNLRSYLSDPEKKKALIQQHLAEYDQWKSAKSNTDQLDAIRAGKQPYWDDPFIKAVVRKDAAGLEASALATTMDHEISSGTADKFGTPSFDPDAYVRDKAAPYVNRLKSDPQMMVDFSTQLDSLRAGVASAHQKALGDAQTAHFEDIARTQIDAAVSNGIDNGMNGQQIQDGLKDTYKALGPRVKGGSLDLKYGRMDDLLLNVLQERAKDPKYAKTALEMLSADRLGADNQTQLGPISAVSRHAAAVEGIKTTAVNTLAQASKQTILNQVAAADVAALQMNNGAFSTIGEFQARNPIDPNKEIKISATDRKQQAVQTVLQNIRDKNNGKPDFDAEMDVMLKNNVAHPEYIPMLKSTYGGLGTTNVSSGPGPQQIQQIQAAGDLYNKIGDKNYIYLTEHLPKQTQEFYETYSTLVRFGGRTPEQAAAEMARSTSSAETNKDPQIVQGKLNDIHDKVAAMDYSWLPFHGGISNGGEMNGRVITLATALARADGIDADTAIKQAVQRFQDSAVYVNGRAVVAPGFLPGDENHVQPILDDLYKKNAARFKELGIGSSSDLSIAPLRNGIFQVVKYDAGSVAIPVRDKAGNVIKLDTPAIRASDIQAVRASQEANTKDVAAKQAVDDQAIHAMVQKYAPDNLLRSLFGLKPNTY